jgi:myosin-1
LSINVATTFSVNLGGKPRKISVEATAGVETPGFKHAGQIIAFEVPSSYSSPI